MLKLAEEVFDVRNDPSQLAITPGVIERLRQIHPMTLTEESTEEGPVAWMIVIPASEHIMKCFVDGEIDEQELYDRTLPGGCYDSIYLCSAMVLPEYRTGGLATRLVVNAVRAIGNDHPIRHLFYWSFTEEGDRLARAVSRLCNLPLLKRKER
jgi:hypothetical protein